jgi:signal transduction histidine kinase
LRRQVRAQTNIIRRNEQELMTVSRQAGMAEVATAVLHNVGNVLNSVNVSATLAAEGLRDSRSGDVALVAAMMKENSSDLGQFLAHDPKGRQIPQYLVRLGEQLAGEKRFLLGELESLTKNIHHIKNIVAMQQSYARVSGVLNTISVADLIENALQMTAGGLDRHDIQIVRDFGAAGSLEITVEENKVLQILVNLISNAKDACAASEQTRKLVTIRVTSDENRVKIACTDNGVGIPPENMTRIFAHGFTTRKNGHGFGLHSAALAAKELGGTLQAASEGPGQGATFSLDLPRSPLPK